MLCCAAPQASWAAAIANIGDQPQVVALRQGQDYTLREIEARGRLYIPGDINVRYRGREVRIEQGEEYAIWPDGTFGPQSRKQYKHQKF